MSRSRVLISCLLAAVMAACASAASPSPASAQAEGATLADLAFMAGCWNGTFDARGQEGVIEERYTPPSSNIMLGTTRYLIGDRGVQFELTSILVGRDGTIVLQPYPNGEKSPASFALTRVGDGEAVFEAPEHDFPKRIVYRRVDGRLVARIDNGEGSEQAQEWEMEAVACGGAGG